MILHKKDVPRRRVTSRTIAFVILAFLLAIPCSGQVFQKVIPSDGLDEVQFGEGIAISNNVAIIGAPGNGSGGETVPTGAAYIFRFDGSSWVEEQKLTPSDGTANDNFGGRVAIDGNVAVVNAGFSGPGNGGIGAYIFRFNGSSWVEEQKLTSPVVIMDYFGSSVAIEGDVVFIGAPGDESQGNDTGAVYVYRYNGNFWVEEQKIIASDAQAEAQFGQPISIENDVAVINARVDGSHRAVYVFRNDGNNWIEKQKLLSPNHALNVFGRALSISGGVIYVGDELDDEFGDAPINPWSGAVYIYRHDGNEWILDTKLTAADASSIQRFGRSLASRHEVVVIGAEERVTPWPDGIVYVYRNNGTDWVEAYRLLTNDEEERSSFGSTLAISRDVVAIGANGIGDPPPSTGAVYFYELAGVTASEELGVSIPISTKITGLHPNPFSRSVTLEFDLLEPTPISIDVYDMAGRLIQNIENAYYTPGLHSIDWAPADLPNGVYLFRIQSGQDSRYIKGALIR